MYAYVLLCFQSKWKAPIVNGQPRQRGEKRYTSRGGACTTKLSFLFVVLSSDYCVDPDTRLMNALSVQRDFNVTLVPDVQEGTCTPFLIYDEGETGAQLPQIPSFYSNGLRDLCHVIVSDRMMLLYLVC